MRNEYRIEENTVHIAITGYKNPTAYAMVDLDDLPKVQAYDRLCRFGGRGNKCYIFCANDGVEEKPVLHHIIAKTPDGWFCNFRNGNSFDCRRSNLVNARKNRPFVFAGKKLVHKHIMRRSRYNIPGRYRYIVMVAQNGKKDYVGTFYTKPEARKARDAYLKERARAEAERESK